MFAISETNYESYLLSASLCFLNKKEGAYSGFAELIKGENVSEEETKQIEYASEYVKKEATTPLMEHKSHIQMLLTMGVRDCPEQVEVYTKVMEVAKVYMESWENGLSHSFFSGEQFGLLDVVMYATTYNLFRYVMVPTWRMQMDEQHITAWRNACSGVECINRTFSNTTIAASIREGGQIDTRPVPELVANLASVAIAKNTNYKKEENQRQKEKQMKAAAEKKTVEVEKSVEEKRPVVVGPIEEGKNDEEKKIFAILDEMRIAHRTVQHEAANTVEDVVAFVDKTLGLPTKNLFLKSKKTSNPKDTGFWLVCAAYDSNVDMKVLTKDLGYKSGSLRFADNELLESILGVHQGHLSLFAKINDKENKVQVIIDKKLFDAENVMLHPLINTSSTVISKNDFRYFADKYAPGYQIKEF